MTTTNTMTMETMNDEMLEQVTGGKEIESNIVPEEQEDYNNEIHPGCGGHILNHNDPFSSCVCDKCGEKHYWYGGFFNKRKRY